MNLLFHLLIELFLSLGLLIDHHCDFALQFRHVSQMVRLKEVFLVCSVLFSIRLRACLLFKLLFEYHLDNFIILAGKLRQLGQVTEQILE